MKRYVWIRLVLGLMLTALVLDACTFSVQVFTTPTAGILPTGTMSPDFLTMYPASPTPTEVPLTLDMPSVTPTLIAIRADTTPMLKIVTNLQAGELIRTLAF